MDIKNLLKCSPHDFENMCLAYADKKYAGIASVYLTPPQKDGGKDIEIILNPSKIVHWGECKAHSRNIDLSSIGKNIVLVQSRKIRKIILFSISEIVYNTKKHIIEVSNHHNYEVVFLDGNKLFSEFRNYGLLEGYATNNFNLSETDIVIEEFTRKENATNYLTLKSNSIFTLKSVNRFSFVLLLGNRDMSSKLIKIEVEDSDKRFKIKNSNYKKVTLKPFSDTSISFSLEANLKYGEEVKLPNIKVTSKYKSAIFNTGIIKVGFHSDIPLTGQEAINNINTARLGLNKGKFNIVEIYGQTGTGKSRFVKELLQYYKDATIFQFLPEHDAYAPLLNILAFIFNIPIASAEKIDNNVFTSILNCKGVGKGYIKVICKYYNNPESLKNNEVKLLLKFIIDSLIKRSYSCLTLIVFEDIEVLPINILRFIYDLTDNLMRIKDCKLKLIVTHNKNNDENKNYNEFKLLINRLSEINAVGKSFVCKCNELGDGDKLLYCLEILGKNETQCAEIITLKYPGVPSVLNNICYALLPLDRENRIKKLNTDLNQITITHFFDNKADYKNHIKKACKWLVLFHNRVPVKFMRQQLSAEILQKMTSDRLIKYDLESGTYQFYQVCYFKIIKGYFGDLKSEAKTILKWLNTQIDCRLYAVKFNCLLASTQFEEAYAFGLTLIDNNNIEVLIKQQIAETLLQQPFKTDDATTRYKILKILAHIYLFSNNLKNGVKYFKSAYLTSLDKNCLIPENERYHIRHEYVNSLIHSGLYGAALNVLNNIDEQSINSLKHRFLLHNRLGVVRTFLYNPVLADRNLKMAMCRANEMRDGFFLSTNYSDIAYLYMKTNCRKKAADYFNKAVREHKKCGYTEMYRDIEINDQTALCHALKKKYKQALVFVERSIKICELNYRSYTWIKSNYIKAFIKVGMGDFREAENIYNVCITRSKIFDSDINLLYSYAGLATLNMLQQQNERVEQLFVKVIRIFKKIKFEGVGVKLAIMKNFALWFYQTDNFDKLSQIRACGLKQINEYINKLEAAAELSSEYVSSLAQNAANIDGYSLLY